ncbi:hypothetical protein IAR55_001944 [Kwoniella newhampshirensis]|uniref:C3HC-type domain-containing protein n=1 Tax=Kwoniella newhampshirensis TaxID=1651941 RepID=A0AAW0Z3I8_9TREE
MSESPDPDLRDVFRLLYAGDEWTFSDDEAEDHDASPASPSIEVEPHPPLDSIAPDMEVEIVDSALSTSDDRGEQSDRYSKKRIFDSLNSLFLNSQPDSKKRRIYQTPPLPPLITAVSIVSSSQPFPHLPNPTVYQPYSPLALLARLMTFQPYSYSSLYPEPLSPLRAALNGWICEKKQGLKCGICKAEWGLGGFEEIRDEKVRNEVARRLGKGFESRHAEGCAWRIRRSPDELFDRLRHLLHPLLSSSLAPLAERLSTECSLSDLIRRTSPINEKRLSSLVASLTPHLSAYTHESLSHLAASLAFFGWYPYHAKPPSSTHVAKTDIVSCRICQRRIGLWTFRNTSPVNGSSERREFDLVNEHLLWCPVRTPEAKEHKSWWEGCQLLKGVGEGEIRKEVIAKKWISVSDKLEKKSWRR